MGKIDIDYQVLHDAFFKYQTKPKMTSVGEIYYEGKEYETDLKGKKPGVLSEETRAALGMTEDGPPPWLINMQRYGPPPSYPNLKIPGLSAPIPPARSSGTTRAGGANPPWTNTGTPSTATCSACARRQTTAPPRKRRRPRTPKAVGRARGAQRV